MKTEQIRDEVTQRLIKLMETTKDRPWRQPWSFGPNVGVPTSADTKIPYRGSNAVTLDITAMIMGYKSKQWNTYKNWDKLGIHPRPGQKATWGFRFGKFGKESEDPSGEVVKKFVPFLRSFAVFNAEQMHGDHIKEFLVDPEGTAAYEVNYDSFDNMIKHHNINISHDADRAAYSPTQDKILMPKRGYFKSVAEYYSVLAHEITHWAETKANEGRKQYGHNEEYADYELSAEIGAAYLLRELGLPATETERTIENSAIYLSGWLKKLKNDNTYIFKAAGRAGRLVDFLIGRNKEEKAEDLELAVA